MKLRDIVSVGAGAVSFAAMSIYTALTLHVSTDITHFLPASDDRRLAEISQQLTDSSATRMMILSVEGRDLDNALAGARGLAEALRKDPEVARCQSGPAPDFAESTYGLLFPHRFQLYSEHPDQDVAKLTSDQGLAAAAPALKGQLMLPTAALVKKIAGADPLMLFPSIVKRLAAAGAGSLDISGGQFVTTDRRHAIVFLETRDSAFKGAAQGPFLEALRETFDRVNAANGGTLQLEQSGVNRFAVDSERIIRADINRISSFSTIAVVVLFLVLYRSLRVLFLSFVPLFYGLAAATAVSMAVFGEIHGLTLAFGSTLIGVCVDYPIHYLNRHWVEPDPLGPWGSLRRIFSALLLGAATTLAGFAGLAWTSFPGMRQLALFATVGIVAAFVATCWLLPPLSARSPKAPPMLRAFTSFMGGLLEAMVRRRGVAVGLAVAAVIICAVGLPRVRWNDDLSSLNRVDEKLLAAEDERVRGEVSRMDAGRFIIVTGTDEAQALDRNDQVYDALLSAKAGGEVSDFSSLHSVVFSPELQRRNLDSFRKASHLSERLPEVFAQAGFKTAFEEFNRELASATDSPLTLTDVLKSPLGDVVRPFRVELGKEIGLITLVRGGNDAAALTARIGRIPGAHYFDQAAFLAQAYGRYRERTIELVGAGLVLMVLIVFAMYRRVRPTIAAALPAILGSTATLALLGLAGVTTNLLHVVSLVLILSAGEDYAVFLLASAKDPAALKASAVSVVLCCLSAVLGFGLLGLSQMPALHALGLTAGIGMLLCLVLAPVALIIAPEGSD